MWKKLSKKRLESLKDTGIRILIYSPTYDPEFRFDIIHFLDLIDCGLDGEKIKSHWWSMSNDANGYCYSDEELLEESTHYHILNSPKKEAEWHDFLFSSRNRRQ